MTNATYVLEFGLGTREGKSLSPSLASLLPWGTQVLLSLQFLSAEYHPERNAAHHAGPLPGMLGLEIRS